MAEALVTEGQQQTSSPAPVAAPAATNGADWFDTLPPELQREGSVSSFKGKPIAEVVKSHVEAQKLVGSSIRLPSDKATPEEKKAALDGIYNKLGRPEKAEGYTFKVETLAMPPGLEWSDEKLSSFKADAHVLGLSNAQAEALLPIFVRELSAFIPDHEKLSTETRKALVDEVGENMTKRMLGNSYRAAKHYGGQAALDWLDKSGAGSERVMIEMLSKIGRDLAEHGVVEGADISNSGVSTASEAKEKIAQVLGDKEHAYHKRDDPRHEDAVQEMLEYHRIAFQEA